MIKLTAQSEEYFQVFIDNYGLGPAWVLLLESVLLKVSDTIPGSWAGLLHQRYNKNYKQCGLGKQLSFIPTEYSVIERSLFLIPKH